ncbi:hypothetical protein [Mycolicibacterium murale]|nr:hypothetical protein [Mycolicibacterium murale]
MSFFNTHSGYADGHPMQSPHGMSECSVNLRNGEDDGALPRSSNSKALTAVVGGDDMAKNSSGGGIGGALFVLFILIAMVPKPVWIALGVAVGLVVVIWLVDKAVTAAQARRTLAEEQARVEEAARAAAEKRERAEKLRKLKQHRIDTLGKDNAARLESALLDVKKVTTSEAARAGWLGDIDFTSDVKGVRENFEKAWALRGVTDKLSALDKPSGDDRKILAEAKATISNLERAAKERIELIRKCAEEAQLIDKSLRTEREDARVAEQRAELTGKLSAMLYGIEATPQIPATDSAVDAVMARVQAYRDIKTQIQHVQSS